MMSTRSALLFTLMAASFLATGCVRVYKTAALDKSFIKAREQTKGVVHKAFDDVKNRREHLKAFKKTAPDFEPRIWQEMKGITEEMAQLGKEMSTFPARIETLRNQLKLVVGKRTKIRSDQPQIWNQVEGFKAKLQGLFKEFKGITSRYTELNQTFRGLSKKLR